MTARQWIKSPKGYVLIAMVAYLLLASIGARDMKGILNGIIAVVASLAVDIIYCRIEKRKRLMLDGAIITGLIISLILSTATSWPIVAATAVIAILSKHLFVYRKKPVFNPAVFGLLLSALIFHTGQSWWGAFGNFPAWTLIFVALGGYPVTSRVNKYAQLFSFLGAFFALLVIMGYYDIGNISSAFRPPFINAALFFGFFMLTDPPTSPAKVKDQIIFGLLVAAAAAIIYGFFGGLTYLFIGLLLGNLYQLVKARASLNVSKKVRAKLDKADKMPV
ncbi:NQR2, RnfD, RnfE family [Paenibacillus sophorae]|uniref:NQR2, RnfD, RnfE family n=1 Tax=Paenibacillus sophorae TaxID=1333845 RepID=A0A1H8IYA2_9BACL|nr:RnfABCDGE type electron transport complex subunit D [Paenibacillus sophorae]QWU16133.1 RnfABCDGE type electron transport complex subunit D [Paenibacillus sophorae]SEN73482.1 NQR2, RnfD, RnfE family [Paenibacillus sophorae]